MAIEFLFPLDPPNRITMRHGEKIWYGSHRGIDIQPLVPKSQEVFVRAPSDGKIHTKWDFKGGNIIELKSIFGSDTILHWMAHNKRYLVADDSTVAKGDKIAVCGNTGAWTTGRHTHWHIYLNGIVADPLQFVTQQFYMDNAIIRNVDTGSFAFLKGGKKQPLSFRTASWADFTVTQVHGAKAYKNYFNVSNEQYKEYAVTWDYFGPESDEFKKQHFND